VETLALYTGGLGGSSHLQGTKPEPVGFALADSPAGQAAWIYEKFQSKTDNHGLAEDALSMDNMLDVTTDKKQENGENLVMLDINVLNQKDEKTAPGRAMVVLLSRG